METEESTSEYLKNCPDVFAGGKDDCTNQNCDCSSEDSTGCMLGICVCTLQTHLKFNETNCIDDMPQQVFFLHRLGLKISLFCPETSIDIVCKTKVK